MQVERVSPDDYLLFFRANIRQLRELAGLSQGELAEEAEIDHSYLQRIEGGRAVPTIRIACQLADAVDVTPGRLFQQADVEPPRGPGRPPQK